MAVADVNFESDGEPLPPLSIAGIAVGGATWLWSVIDAPVSANHINKERIRALKKHNLSGGIGITVSFRKYPGIFFKFSFVPDAEMEVTVE